MKNYLIIVLLTYITSIFSQTTTKYETIIISTGHASLTSEVKKNGTALEVWIKNNHITKTFKVNFTAKVSLKGTKGEIEKVLFTTVTLNPNDDDYAITNIGEADPSKNLYWSLAGGRFENFTWSESNDTNNSSNSSVTNNNIPKSSTSYNSQSNTLPKSTTDRNISNNQNSSNQGVSQEDINALLERNAQESNRILGLSSSNEYKSTEKVVEEGVVGVVNILLETRQANLELEEREAERKRIQAEKIRIDKENKQRIINNRSTIINKFTAKDIPLSTREKASKIYYFIYAFDNNNLNQEYGATVYVSNVFEIGTFNDGTRAYTATIKNEISNLTQYNEVLHGYYYSEDEANSLRESFVNLLASNDVAIKKINYKGKPSSKKESVTKTTTNDSKYGKTININDQNFAPAKLNDSKPTEVPKRNIEKAQEEESKKQSKYGKTIIID